jgi:FkbM family methyltransferase
MDPRLLTHLQDLIKNATKTPSQLKQDAIALFFNDFKKNGFFVEFGACDGFSFSNTWVLEKFFDWTGVLAEPNPQWHDAIRKNRGCEIELKAVSAHTGEFVEFGVMDNENPIAKELGGLTKYLDQSILNLAKTFKVETISLSDLLRFWQVPQTIDYISIDTEGNELSIIEEFDFSQYRFNFLSIEHNFRAERPQLQEIMAKNGYVRLDCDELSAFDDWYIHNSHALADLVHG